MAAQVPFLRALSPWILKDFPDPYRFHMGYQYYFNRKVLVSPNGERKQAFYVLRDWYLELAEHWSAVFR